MSIEVSGLLLNLPENLEDADIYRDAPFVIFEKSNFLDADVYDRLVDEIYSASDFDYIFTGKGEKQKFSVNGSNLYKVSNPTLKKLCEALLSDEFYNWFSTTHLPYFESYKIKIHIRKPSSMIFRIIKKIRNILKLPISFYYTEIEYSSIGKDSYIPPHTDAPKKRLSFVYYLPSKNIELTDEMKRTLGTTFWGAKETAENPLRRFDCRLLEGDELKQFYQDYLVIHTGEYAPNKIAGFIKSDNSWHSVEENKYNYDRRAIVINVWEA